MTDEGARDEYDVEADPYEQYDEGGVARADVPAADPRGRPRGRRSHVPEVDRPRAPPDEGGRGPARQARRAERHGGEERADRGEPAPRGVDRQALLRPRPDAARPDPGGQPRPHPRGREVRLAARLQVLHVRDLVDPPGDHARAGRPVAHDPDSRAHGRADEQGRSRRGARCCRRPGASRPRPRSPRSSRGWRRSRSRTSSSSARSPSRSRRRSAARRATPRSATSSRTRSGSAPTRLSRRSSATTTSRRRSRASRGASGASSSCATASPATAR